MAAPLCESSSLAKPYFTVSPSTSGTFNSQKCYYRKALAGSSFLGGEHLQMFAPKSTISRKGSYSNNRMRRMGMVTVASLGGFLGGIFKGTDTGESTRQQYAATVSTINGMEAEMSALSDSELREKTSMLRERAQQGQSLESLLPVRIILCFFFLSFFSALIFQFFVAEIC